MGEVGEEWLVIANGDRNLKHSGQRPVGYVLITLSSSSSSPCGIHLNHVVIIIINLWAKGRETLPNQMNFRKSSGRKKKLEEIGKKLDDDEM